MNYLVVNADEFGLTDKVSAGIVETIARGIVSSTSAMVCNPGAVENLKIWAPKVAGYVGVHLQLTDGIPVSEPAKLPSLVKSSGHFPRGWRELGIPDEDEIRREWHGQMEKIFSLGIQPVRVDTHHNVHKFPQVFKVYSEIAQNYKLAARSLSSNMTKRLRSLGIACPDHFEKKWYGEEEEVTVDRFILSIQHAFRKIGHNGIVEVMCHPGYNDGELEVKSNYTSIREKNYPVTCSPGLPSRLESLGIRLLKGAEIQNCQNIGVGNKEN